MPENVRRIGHVGTADHNAFNASPLAVLNVARDSMAEIDFSPATRVFEAAGAGACLITDAWEGIEMFLQPGTEVLVARDGREVAEHLAALTPQHARTIGEAARRRILAGHTAGHRAAELKRHLAEAASRKASVPPRAYGSVDGAFAARGRFDPAAAPPRSLRRLPAMASALLPVLGIGSVLLLAWLLSENRRAVPWRTVIGGMALQLALALAALLFHWGVLQAVSRGFAWVLRRWLGVGGALGLGAATHIFVGMIEAPLLIRPWLARLQRGELFALMTCGIAGTMMIIYAAILGPLMWLIGVPWAESAAAAELMGTKTVLNEFVAYIGLANTPAEALSERSRIILTYAMCGFANFGSLGILIGGMGAMVPERREEIVGLGLRSILSGTLATCTSGALAGILA